MSFLVPPTRGAAGSHSSKCKTKPRRPRRGHIRIITSAKARAARSEIEVEWTVSAHEVSDYDFITIADAHSDPDDHYEYIYNAAAAKQGVSVLSADELDLENPTTEFVVRYINIDSDILAESTSFWWGPVSGASTELSSCDCRAAAVVQVGPVGVRVGRMA